MKDNIALIVCLHGDEKIGFKIKEKLSNKFTVIFGNPEAVNKNTRYIDIDLNRAFPGKEKGNYEEERAFRLLQELSAFKYIVDIHSSSSEMDVFGIITTPTEEKIELAKKLGLKRVLLMTKKLANGGSLIDNVNCGISLEFGPHEDEKKAQELINLMGKFPNDPSNQIQIFEAFELIKGENDAKYFIKNFEEVKKGQLIAEGKKKYFAQFDFIPFFVGEKAYKGTLCIAAKKLI